MIRKIVQGAALASIVMGLAACNTVKGLGEDISSVGRAGEEAIN